MQKRLLLALALLCTSSACLLAQWISANGPEGLGNYSALFKDNNTFWAPTSGGLYFSSDDGASWQRHPDILHDDDVHNVVRKGNLLFAIARGQNTAITAYEHHIYKSSNNGVTWIKTNVPPDISWQDQPFIGVLQNYLILYENGPYIYRSADDGQSWQEISYPMDYYPDLRHDDKNIILRGYQEGVFMSKDGCDSWQQIADSAQQFVDIFLLQDSVILGHGYPNNVSSFVYSPDLGQTWLPMDPLPGSGSYEQFFPGAGDTLFLQNGETYFSVNKGKSWTYYGDLDAYRSPFLQTSDGGALRNERGVVEKYDPATQTWSRRDAGLLAQAVYEIVSNEEYVFAVGGSAELYRKPVKGNAAWQRINIDRPYVNYPKLAISHDTLYIAWYDVVYQLTDNGAGALDSVATVLTGTTLDQLSVQGDYLVVEQNNTIILVNRFTRTIQPVDNLPSTTGQFNHFLRIIGNRWVYTDNGGTVYVSEDQGSTWTEKFEQYLPGNNSKNHLYYLNEHLYFVTRSHIAISGDQGDTWTTSNTGLPLNSNDDITLVNGMAASGNLLFLSTYWRGVFVSTDFGDSWQPYSQGLPRHRGASLAASSEKVFLGTFTASVWERDIKYEALEGLVYADLNNNGTKDPGEQALPNVLIASEPSGLYSKSGNDGKFSVLAVGTDSLKAIANSPHAFVNPGSYLAGQVANGNYKFGIYYIPNVKDLRITLTLSQPLSPGFQRELNITCTNVGTTTLSPEVLVSIPAPISLLQAVPAPVSVQGDSVLWQLASLAPQQSTSISALIEVPPTVGIGELFTFEGLIYSAAGDDAVPADNKDVLREAVVGSFDPNDKSVSPQSFFTPTQYDAGERLVYTIRFQNTGNYPATFVRIIDTLQTALDPSSIQVLAYSHPVKWSLRPQQVLEFFFENIQLPDSTSDEANSHGFVKFSLRPRANLPLGLPIRNRASIYFDYNKPVETNTVSNLFDFVSRVLEANLQPLQLFPNPTSNTVQVQKPTDSAGELWVFDANGKLVLTQKIHAASSQLDLSRMPAGAYWLVLKEAEGSRVGKLIRQ